MDWYTLKVLLQMFYRFLQLLSQEAGLEDGYILQCNTVCRLPCRTHKPCMSCCPGCTRIFTEDVIYNILYLEIKKKLYPEDFLIRASVFYNELCYNKGEIDIRTGIKRYY